MSMPHCGSWSSSLSLLQNMVGGWNSSPHFFNIASGSIKKINTSKIRLPFLQILYDYSNFTNNHRKPRPYPHELRLPHTQFQSDPLGIMHFLWRPMCFLLGGRGGSIVKHCIVICNEPHISFSTTSMITWCNTNTACFKSSQPLCGGFSGWLIASFIGGQKQSNCLGSSLSCFSRTGFGGLREGLGFPSRGPAYAGRLAAPTAEWDSGRERWQGFKGVAKILCYFFRNDTLLSCINTNPNPNLYFTFKCVRKAWIKNILKKKSSFWLKLIGIWLPFSFDVSFCEPFCLFLKNLWNWLVLHLWNLHAPSLHFDFVSSSCIHAIPFSNFQKRECLAVISRWSPNVD